MTDFKNKARLGHAVVVASTAKALLVRIDEDDLAERWIPQSQIDDDSEVWRGGDEGELIVNEWWAEQNSLI